MTVRFTSPRQAIQVYFAARAHGPRAARPKYDGMPSVGRYAAAQDGLIETVGGILYGPIIAEPYTDAHGEHHGGCGVEKGSALERMIIRWADGVLERTPAIRNVEIRMRRLLRVAGLMAPATRVVRTEERDEQGRVFARYRDIVLPLDAEIDA
jgi:hypothetical protein